MNILHILSQREVTGAEAYAIALANRQLAVGHRVFVASDTLSMQTQAAFIPLPISERTYVQRARNILALRRIVQRENIELIHAHSRAASWVSNIAAKLSHVPFISTVHGRQHLHLSSTSFNVYGRAIIAISETIRTHLINELGINPNFVSVVPNGIDFELHRPVSSKEKIPDCSEPKTMTFMGRLTGPKGDIARFLMREIFPRVLDRVNVRLVLVGGMMIPDDIPKMVDELNRKYNRSCVILEGFQTNLGKFFADADLVICAGRLAAESLSYRKRTIAFGESNYVGEVTAETFELATLTNFGDTGEHLSPPTETVVNDIVSILSQRPNTHEAERLQQLVESRYDMNRVAERIDVVYARERERIHAPATIPVLMYHSVVPDVPTKSHHGIWVTAQDFERQLRSLRRRGFNGVTFADYKDFLAGKKNLPAKPVILTFDDGYEDNYTLAFPLLQRYGFTAVIYAVADVLRRENYWDADQPRQQLLSFAQLRELQQHGIEIGSHTVTHKKLTSISLNEMQNEIVNSKKLLEEELRAEVVSFAYPYGALNEHAKQVARDAGYQFAVAADTGPLKFSSDRFEIRRTQVFPWTGRFGFWKKTLPLYQRYKIFKAQPKA